ncbi:MAG: hypothetical protein CMH30_08310 [Micavibrio sp.]|nr:hypothetical protein [Micavibrio sp.]
MDILGLVIDVIIVVMLCWTIYVATKLSRNLEVFNKTKKDLSSLITQISTSVTKANDALTTFKSAVNESGGVLDKRISEAKMLSDELELIYQSSNRVADRLEKLTEGAPRPSSAPRRDANEATKKPETQKKTETKDSGKDVSWIKKKLGKASGGKEAVAGGLFSIRDPEFEQGLKESAENASDSWDGPEDIETDAERALYKALKKRTN